MYDPYILKKSMHLMCGLTATLALKGSLKKWMGSWCL